MDNYNPNPVNESALETLFNLPQSITTQADTELVDVLSDTKPRELSPLDMLITPADVRAILNENEES